MQMLPDKPQEKGGGGSLRGLCCACKRSLMSHCTWLRYKAPALPAQAPVCTRTQLHSRAQACWLQVTRLAGSLLAMLQASLMITW